MGIENAEAGGDSLPARRLVFAYYVTGHGFGHATRVVEIARHLIEAGHEVNLVTGAPEFVFRSEIKSSNLKIRNVLLDCGAVQTDALTVDRLASLEKYRQTVVKPRNLILAAEVEWLKSIKADLVVSDVVPVVCRAAADAGIRSVCVTNFSWDFIYAEYVMTEGFQHHSIVWQAECDAELPHKIVVCDPVIVGFCKWNQSCECGIPPVTEPSIPQTQLDEPGHCNILLPTPT